MGGVLACRPQMFLLRPSVQAYKGTFLAAGGHTRQSGIESLESNHADLIVYGRHFLANPDLPRRFELDAPLNQYDRDSFYSADLEKVGPSMALNLGIAGPLLEFTWAPVE